MPKYIVGIREVHVSFREVDAKTPEEAKSLADDIQCEIFCEYSHTLDQDTWSVELVEKARDSG
jgi:hypothetical protein